MPSYRIFQILFLASFSIAMVIDILYGISPWVYGSILTISLVILAYGSSQINSNFFIETICSGDSNEKKIALTFDDGPHPEFTPRILDILKKHNVPATFFVIGKNIDGNENILKRMNSEGHAIGNHSFSHSYFFDFYSKKKVQTEIEKTQTIISKTIGKKTCPFRPPFGVTNPQIAQAVKALQLDVIGWNIRSFDTILKVENKVLNRVIRKLRPGSIILFHDTNSLTVNVLINLFEYLNTNNFKVIPLEELTNTTSSCE